MNYTCLSTTACCRILLSAESVADNKIGKLLLLSNVMSFFSELKNLYVTNNLL